MCCCRGRMNEWRGVCGWRANEVALWLDAINVPSENFLRNMHNNPLRRLLPLIAQQLHSGGNHYFLLRPLWTLFFRSNFLLPPARFILGSQAANCRRAREREANDFLIYFHFIRLAWRGERKERPHHNHIDLFQPKAEATRNLTLHFCGPGKELDLQFLIKTFRLTSTFSAGLTQTGFNASSAEEAKSFRPPKETFSLLTSYTEACSPCHV